MNSKKSIIAKALPSLLFLCLCTSAHAAGFTVVSTQSQLVDGEYRVSAQLGLELSTEVNEAIQNGIPVTLNVDVEVLKRRQYLWAQSIIVSQQQYRLQYHALSEQYLVKNINSGEQTFYRVLEDALYNLEHVTNLPFIKADKLEPRREYVARIRTGVNIKDLPAPLRFFAYFSPGWNLNSGWFTWSMTEHDPGLSGVRG